MLSGDVGFGFVAPSSLPVNLDSRLMFFLPLVVMLVVV